MSMSKVIITTRPTTNFDTVNHTESGVPQIGLESTKYKRIIVQTTIENVNSPT